MIKINKGFTLIELLLVVSILGILAGVMTSVINPNVQRNKAQDAIKRSNIEKLAQSIEAYCAGEGVCPSVNTDTVLRNTYVKQWPADISYYWGNSYRDFEINVALSSNSSKFYRYNSVWGSIKECTGRIGGSNWSSTNPTCTP